MKLRNAVLFVALALLPVLLVSCFLQGPAAARGSIAFSVSSKAIGKSFSASAETVRVYLMSGETLYPIQPAGYDQVNFTAGSTTVTYTSPPIPAGTYSLMIAVGTTVNGAFMTSDYADPVDVTVSPGVNTPVSVTLKASPFTDYGLWGQNVTGAANVGGNLYVSTKTDLYQPSLAPIAVGPSLAPVGPGSTINSISCRL